MLSDLADTTAAVTDVRAEFRQILEACYPRASDYLILQCSASAVFPDGKSAH
jgi:hypothetical protein